MKDIKFLQGNEACALAGIRAGMNFYAGYPITPSSEIAEVCSRELPKIGGRFIQMEDEIASIAAICGASLAGSKVMTATSGPGFSLMQEALGYGIMAEIPLVVVNVMRGGPSTGHPTGASQGDLMQARWGTHGDHPIIALYPASIPEVWSETMRAFNLAEKFRQPVILLMDEILAHVRESVCLEESTIEVVNRKLPAPGQKDYLPYAIHDDSLVPVVPNYGTGYKFHTTGLYHDETGFPDVNDELIRNFLERLHQKIEKNIEQIQSWKTIHTDDMDVLFLSVGTQSRAVEMAIEMLQERGIKAGLFRPLTVWPFPSEEFSKQAAKVKHVFVVEMNRGQLCGEMKKYVHPQNELHSINRLDSKMVTPEYIADFVKGVVSHVK